MQTVFIFILFVFLNLVLLYVYNRSYPSNVFSSSYPLKMYQRSSNEFYGTLLINTKARDYILKGQDKHIFKYYGDNCKLNGNLDGRMYLAWGSEEDVLPLDLGQYRIINKAIGQKVYVDSDRKPLFRTMLVKCTFPFTVGSPSTIILSALPNGFHYFDNDTPLLPEVDLMAEVVVPPTNVPGVINCGRQLFGNITGDLLARHVDNGLGNGIDHFVFYDMGHVVFHRTDALKNHIESGVVTIINATDTLQYVHDTPLVAMDTKAAAQWYTRYDCMNRYLNSNWIGFLDFDEFVMGPVNLTTSSPVVHFSGIHGDPQKYCNLHYIPKQYLQKYSGKSPSKYFVQPRLVFMPSMRIHAYPTKRVKYIKNKFVHHRCINKVIEIV